MLIKLYMRPLLQQPGHIIAPKALWRLPWRDA